MPGLRVAFYRSFGLNMAALDEPGNSLPDGILQPEIFVARMRFSQRVGDVKRQKSRY